MGRSLRIASDGRDRRIGGTDRFSAQRREAVRRESNKLRSGPPYWDEEPDPALSSLQIEG